ncbi:NAD(P)/FAD-dependent oxidoreductase [Arthrobacter halodurans]|uniref:NAD(P)/FAD-dependent oxidoreductase n=1 Tax=Arthrobacter halodurans TaxID=516699 RepID=A0ABV4URY8_9MICC
MVKSAAQENLGEYDVVVVGGGAAGLSGALALARARRSVLVVDAGDPRNAPAGHVHNYLGLEGTPPRDLIAAGRRDAASYGADFRAGEVTAARRGSDGMFHLDVRVDGDRDADGDGDVDGNHGGAVRARRLLIASGVVDRRPDIDGLAGRWGRDVLHCPYCHGWEIRDKPLGIVATHVAAAVHQALLWRQWTDDVVLFLHTAGSPGDAALEQLEARGIRVVPGKVEALETRGDRLSGVRLAGGAVVPREAVAVFSRVEVRGEFLAQLGVEAVEVAQGDVPMGTSIPVDPMGATPVPGVYAAGNVANPAAQVISSAAAGLMAGAAINADLVAEDTRRAVEARAVGARAGSTAAAGGAG